jgi:drug/metabolite transporter superfamily protein YnfA
MSVLRSLLLFTLAALAEIGGAWMVWQGLRESRLAESTRSATHPRRLTGHGPG